MIRLLPGSAALSLGVVVGATGRRPRAAPGGEVGFGPCVRRDASGALCSLEGVESGRGDPPLLPVQLVAAGEVTALDPGPHGGGAFPKEGGEVVHGAIDGRRERSVSCWHLLGEAAQNPVTGHE